MTVDQVTIDKMMSIYKMIVDEMPPVKMTVNDDCRQNDRQVQIK